MFSIFVCLYFTSVYADLKVQDLTHLHGKNALWYPYMPAFNFTSLHAEYQSGGYWLESNYFGQPEHGGTHLDAPCHFVEGKWRVHDIPVDRLIGPGVIINVTHATEQNADYRATKDDLLAWENKYGNIPDNAVVLLKTGWSKRHPALASVYNTNNIYDKTTYHFPGWHEDGINWLVKERNIYILGTDTPSNDYAQRTNFTVHMIIGKQNIAGVENVNNLEKIPEKGATIYAAVIKLENGSGGPCRIFATYSDNVNSGIKVMTSIPVIVASYLLTSFRL